MKKYFSTNRIIILVVVLLVLVISFYTLTKRKYPIEVFRVRTGNIISDFSARGEVRTENYQKVRAVDNSKVEFILQTGTNVNTGEVILRINDDAINAQKKSLDTGILGYRLKIKQLLKRRTHLKSVYELGGTSKSDIEKLEDEISITRSELKKSEALMESVKEKHKNFEVKARFTGQVIFSGFSVGDDVYAGDTVITLSDPDTVYVYTEIDNADYNNVFQGQRVEISFHGSDKKKFKGKVCEISVLPETPFNMGYMRRERKFSVKVDVKRADNFPVQVNLSCSLLFIIHDIKNCLLVPLNCVQYDREDNPYVIVVEKKHVRKRSVVLGASNNTYIQIKKGLNKGDLLVTNTEILPEVIPYRGVKVRIVKTDREQSLPSK